MITSSIPSRQPKREVWSRERLQHQRAIALGHSIDATTARNYSSALNSYLNFVKNHQFDVEPTTDTLSFYTVYLSHYLKPDSVDTYLSGICQQLEPFFPNVRDNRKAILVRRTLDGCKRLRAIATTRKQALTIDNLNTVIEHYSTSSHHDDLLFVAQLIVGFFALMRLGELTFPDNKTIQNPAKLSKRTSVVSKTQSFQFFLPGHKADRFFEGNNIVLMNSSDNIDIFRHFANYLNSRDRLHPFSSPLWLRKNGQIPTRSFFIQRLRLHFDASIAGQSMRAGGATALAEQGVAPSLIQAIGRWSSDAFRIYVRKNPVLIQAMLHSKSISTLTDV